MGFEPLICPRNRYSCTPLTNLPESKSENPNLPFSMFPLLVLAASAVYDAAFRPGHGYTLSKSSESSSPHRPLVADASSPSLLWPPVAILTPHECPSRKSYEKPLRQNSTPHVATVFCIWPLRGVLGVSYSSASEALMSCMSCMSCM